MSTRTILSALLCASFIASAFAGHQLATHSDNAHPALKSAQPSASPTQETTTQQVPGGQWVTHKTTGSENGIHYTFSTSEFVPDHTTPSNSQKPIMQIKQMPHHQGEQMTFAYQYPHTQEKVYERAQTERLTPRQAQQVNTAFMKEQKLFNQQMAQMMHQTMQMQAQMQHQMALMQQAMQKAFTHN